MSSHSKLEFVALDISGKNYLSWIIDAEIHLDAMGLGDTIKEGNVAPIQDRAKAMIFLRHHLQEGLKSEYLTIKDPLVLWRNLKERYDYQKTIILPKVRYEWMHLRLHDFKSVNEYNSAIFRISSKLRLCGEDVTENDMLEKTFSTFHPLNAILQQRCREKGFTKYSQLISFLLVAEQNNQLLLNDHEHRPTCSSPFPEVNVTMINNNERRRGSIYGPLRGRGRDLEYNKYISYHSKWKNNIDEKQEGIRGQRKIVKKYENLCYRCGMKGHWSRTCRTAKHLIDLYQASLKEKEEGIEVNPVSFFDGLDNDPIDVTNLDVSNFLVNQPENNDILDGGEYLK